MYILTYFLLYIFVVRDNLKTQFIKYFIKKRAIYVFPIFPDERFSKSKMLHFTPTVSPVVWNLLFFKVLCRQKIFCCAESHNSSTDTSERQH